MPTDEQRAADLARAFHEAYERLAPSFGYETRRESAAPWESVPEQNRALMTAVCAEVMAPLLASREAAARAGAVEEAAAEVDDAAAHYPAHTFPPESTSRDAISGTALRRVLPGIAMRIRALAATPPDRVVVAVSDLRHALGTCGCAETIRDRGLGCEHEWPAEHRAALARLGASDA